MTELMKTTSNILRQNPLIFSTICPILTIMIFGLAFLIPSPVTDAEFLYLFTGCAFMPLLSLIGLISSGMLISKVNSKSTQILGAFMLLLNAIASALGMVFIIVVGLVGTTGSY